MNHSSLADGRMQVVIVGNTSSLPAKPASQQIPHATGELLNRKQCGQAIQVPKFRLLPKKERVLQSAEKDVVAGSNGSEPAYIRHRQQTQDELDSKVEYDLDSEDEGWLAKRNKKVGCSQNPPACLLDGDPRELKHGVI